MALGILIAVRVSESQAELVDEYRMKHGGLSRSAAVRDLAAQQLRYQKWAEQRRARNLPPFPSSRLPKLEFSKEKFANVARVTDALRERNPNASDEDLGRMLLGSMNVFHGLREKTKKLVRRVARQHENEKLERNMNESLEARRSAGGGG